MCISLGMPLEKFKQVSTLSHTLSFLITNDCIGESSGGKVSFAFQA